MKKLLLVSCCMLIAVTACLAQKYAIIDTRYILDKMPEFGQSAKQLDAIAADWQRDIDAKQLALTRCTRILTPSR